MVATAIPFTPMAGININPNIKIGFSKIFKKKLKMRRFLYVFVSPSACNKEFKHTTRINITEPENITSVYSKPNDCTSLEVTIILKISSAYVNPM